MMNVRLLDHFYQKKNIVKATMRKWAERTTTEKHTGGERPPGEPYPAHRRLECGRICASAFGLRSHRRMHQRDPAQGRHVIIGNEWQP